MLKLKSSFGATRFDFQLHVHTLQPWPVGNKGIAIGWQRGKRRRGATGSVLPLPSQEKGGGTVVRFNERVNFKSTLYKVPGATERQGQLGPFKRKCVILAVLETDGRTHATSALGRVVIDLSEFASIDSQELRTFPVACGKNIQAAVGGDPQLTVTIRCRWKKAGVDFTEDEAASMSTDQSGSTLTGSIKDFFSRFSSSGRSGRGGGGSGGGAGGAGGPSRGAMEAIGEDDGSPGGSRRRSSAGAGGGGGFELSGSPRLTSQDVNEADWEGLDHSSDDPGLGADRAPDFPAGGAFPLGGGDDDDEEEGGGKAGGSRLVSVAVCGGGLEAARAGESGGRESPEAPAVSQISASEESEVDLGRAGSVGSASWDGAEEAEVVVGSGGLELSEGDHAAVSSEEPPEPGADSEEAERDGEEEAPAPDGDGPGESSKHGAPPVGDLRPPGGAGGPPSSPDPSTGSQTPPAHSPSPLSKGPTPAPMADPPAPGRRSPPPSPSALFSQQPAASGAGAPPAPAAGTRGARALGGEPREQGDVLTRQQEELLAAAASEFCLYLAQHPIFPGRKPARAVHAPARRAARTLACLGRQDGLAFGHSVLRHIRCAAVADRSDLRQLAFWWTNACHLRACLRGLEPGVRGGGQEQGPQLHWAAEAYVPQLLDQERLIFEEIVSYVWTHTLVPKVASARARAPSGAGTNKRGAHEAALRKWIEALEAANSQLRGLGREGHVNALRQQVVLELLRRIDAMLFHYLLTAPPDAAAGTAAGAAAPSDASAASSSAASDHDPLACAPRASGGGGASGGLGGGFGGGGGSSLSDAGGWGLGSSLQLSQQQQSHHHQQAWTGGGAPPLDDSVLFFSRGSLTFGTGMQLKMACTRLQQWAFGEGGLRDVWAQLAQQGQSLFRLMRGASDLLMMPKEMLLDDDIRQDTVALPIGTVAYMISRFRPDDYAPEGIAAHIASGLLQAAVAAGADASGPPPLDLEGRSFYCSPSDGALLEKVEAGEEPGLSYGTDSEEELAAVGDLGPDLGTAPPTRFQLLHHLWRHHAPTAPQAEGEAEAL